MSTERHTVSPGEIDDHLHLVCWRASRSLRHQLFHLGETSCSGHPCEQCHDFHLDHVDKMASANWVAGTKNPEAFEAKVARSRAYDVLRDRRSKAGLLCRPERLPRFAVDALEDPLQRLLIDMLFFVGAPNDRLGPEDLWPVGGWVEVHGHSVDEVRRSIRTVLARLGAVRPEWTNKNLLDPLARKAIASPGDLPPAGELPPGAWAPSAEDVALDSMSSLVGVLQPVVVERLAGGRRPAAALASAIGEVWGAAAAQRARRSEDWGPLVEWAAGLAAALRQCGNQRREPRPSATRRGSGHSAMEEAA
ncbi:MAG: hypothetical protein ACRD1K_21085 [Acidimicrobiales bacterium]